MVANRTPSDIDTLAHHIARQAIIKLDPDVDPNDQPDRTRANWLPGQVHSGIEMVGLAAVAYPFAEELLKILLEVGFKEWIAAKLAHKRDVTKPEHRLNADQIRTVLKVFDELASKRLEPEEACAMENALLRCLVLDE